MFGWREVEFRKCLQMEFFRQREGEFGTFGKRGWGNYLVNKTGRIREVANSEVNLQVG